MKQPEINKLLQDILGAKNVYYQPPAEIKMHYPCIRYEPSSLRTQKADNHGYHVTRSYNVMYIAKKQDDDVVMRLARLPMSRHDRSYKASGLYHEVFTIYF